jgi:hypothetical protein
VDGYKIYNFAELSKSYLVEDEIKNIKLNKERIHFAYVSQYYNVKLIHHHVTNNFYLDFIKEKGTK